MRSDPKPSPKAKKPRKALARSPIKRKRKVTGEKNMFEEIWSERPHKCHKCGRPLKEFNVSNFHHVIPKSRGEKYRLEKNNIQIVCFQCHFNIHNK